jgi:chromosome segregation ATPase
LNAKHAIELDTLRRQIDELQLSLSSQQQPSSDQSTPHDVVQLQQKVTELEFLLDESRASVDGLQIECEKAEEKRKELLMCMDELEKEKQNLLFEKGIISFG